MFAELLLNRLRSGSPGARSTAKSVDTPGRGRSGDHRAGATGEGGDRDAYDVLVTTVTFEEKGGKTLLVMHELHSSKEALDAAGTGAADAMAETFAQLDELLLTLGASLGQS